MIALQDDEKAHFLNHLSRDKPISYKRFRLVKQTDFYFFDFFLMKFESCVFTFTLDQSAWSCTIDVTKEEHSLDGALLYEFREFAWNCQLAPR